MVPQMKKFTWLCPQTGLLTWRYKYSNSIILLGGKAVYTFSFGVALSQHGSLAATCMEGGNAAKMG